MRFLLSKRGFVRYARTICCLLGRCGTVRHMRISRGSFCGYLTTIGEFSCKVSSDEGESRCTLALANKVGED